MFKTRQEKTREKIKEKGSSVVNAVFVILLSLSVTSLMVLYIDRLPSNIIEGGIATQDIRADQNYEITDQVATQKLKDEAALKSLPVYNFDHLILKDRKEHIQSSFEKARVELVELAKSNPGITEFSQIAEDQLRQNFQNNLGSVLESDVYDLIRKQNYSVDLEKVLLVLLEDIQRKYIIVDKGELKLRQETGVVIHVGDEANVTVDEIVMNDLSAILSLEDAKNYFDDRKIATLQKKYNLEFVDSKDIKNALRVLPSMIKVNLTYDKARSDERKNRAISNVQNIIYKLQKGQTIVRRGDRYEARHITILDGVRKSRLQTNLVLKFIGVFFLVLTVLMVTFLFARWNIREFAPSKKDLNFLGLVLITFLATLRMGSFIGSSMQDTLPFPVEMMTFYYVIPVAAGAMLVRYVLTPVVAQFFAVVLSLFAGLFLENNFEMTVYYLISGLASAHFIANVERRSSVLTRGVYLGLVQTFVVLCISIINTISTTNTISPELILTNCIFAFLGGLASAVFLLVLSPIVEAVFNYTTNIQLLELANMNHPLLREMVVRSPGTYLHSQLVGTLAEAGTRAIGGNSLLARVGSYYHDIGKMKKHQYFIENQKGENPHDTLAPSMSALIIEAHVRDGLEMAREYKLPKVIVDFIPEHQGTKLIGYFYHKAQKEAGEDKDKIDEKDYRYPGPKPQSRESGVVMLADTIEAAVRSMPDKSPQKIRAQVEKLVNMHFVDGQLDECDLTLRDLHLIVDAFVKMLIGIYHQRVEYPENEKKKKPALARVTQDDAPNLQQMPKASNIAPLFKDKS